MRGFDSASRSDRGGYPARLVRCRGHRGIDRRHVDARRGHRPGGSADSRDRDVCAERRRRRSKSRMNRWWEAAPPERQSLPHTTWCNADRDIKGRRRRGCGSCATGVNDSAFSSGSFGPISDHNAPNHQPTNTHVAVQLADLLADPWHRGTRINESGQGSWR